MNKQQRELVRDGLLSARGYLRGSLAGRVTAATLTDGTVELLTKLERALGATLETSMRHDHGAYARCSFCGRYTADLCALESGSTRERARCDCGELDGWSGSFEAPSKDAQWSIGRHWLLGGGR